MKSLYVLLVLAEFSLFGQTPDDNNRSIEKTIVSFTNHDIDKDRNIPLGTGFILKKDILVCIITARHIADLTDPNTIIGVLAGNQPKFLKLGDISLSKNLMWYYHENADLAAIRIKNPGVETLHAFSREQLLKNDELPTLERPIIAVGFPLGLGMKRFEPITQKYQRVSEMIEAKSDYFPQDAKYYLLDRPAIDGYSGAPLFNVPGVYNIVGGFNYVKNFLLVGVVAGTISDNTGGKLGAVIPVIFVGELFDDIQNQYHNVK